jgi:acetoin utilization deacetylase AcuC-like enzyme
MTLAVVRPEDVSAQGAPWITDPHGRQIPSHETAARTESILMGFERSGCCTVLPTPALESAAVDSVLHACHDRDYLTYLESFGGEASSAQSALDDRFARPGREPHTPAFPGVFEVGRGSVQTALGAAQLLLAGSNAAYAACRPPGHHAGPRWPGGYCYLNNAMAAARWLCDGGAGPIAVIDLDFHFGDGSAAIAKRWGDVFFCSLNASAHSEYPWMETEPTDADQVLRSFLDPPSETEYLEALQHVLWECSARSVDALVVSLGYDLIEGDPHGKWSLSPAIFGRLGETLVGTGVPVCFVQEGGYAVDRLGECSCHLARGVSGQ